MKLHKYAMVGLLLLLLSTTSLFVFAQEEGPGDYQGIIPIPNPNPPPPPPEGSAEVEIIAAAGGVTDPAAGTSYYPNGTLLTITATPNEGFRFVHWIAKGYYLAEVYAPPTIIIPDEKIPPQQTYTTGAPIFVSMTIAQNPFTFDCGYGYVFSYEPVFVPTTTTLSTDTIVVIEQSIGGNTDPDPGTYAASEDTAFSLTAIADEGFEFQYWVVSGTNTPGHGTGDTEVDKLVVSDNPLSITCGYGYTYSYQPIFTPADAETLEAIDLTYYYLAIAVLAVVAIVAVAVALLLYRKK